MASSKPDILLILLQKLMEEGNMLYKVSYGGILNLGAFYLNLLQTISCQKQTVSSLFIAVSSPLCAFLRRDV